MGKRVCPDEVVVVAGAYSTAASVEVVAASRRHQDRFWELEVFPKRF